MSNLADCFPIPSWPPKRIGSIWVATRQEKSGYWKKHTVSVYRQIFWDWVDTQHLEVGKVSRINERSKP